VCTRDAPGMNGAARREINLANEAEAGEHLVFQFHYARRRRDHQMQDMTLLVTWPGGACKGHVGIASHQLVHRYWHILTKPCS
jgi:hypothetical protein